ncbi:MAG: tetratricopeptide repeat protein, partial [Planctomycetes bacterium]|nr:tetratricopeptide repeat protein [Planctomycetota bacterium]
SRRDTTDDLDTFLGVLGRVAEALSYAHSRGVVHRDLKPSNVMLGTFGEVLVTDWGLAKVFQEGPVEDRPEERDEDTGRIRTIRTKSDGLTSLSGSVLGTPAYMAPEQARGEVEFVDARADVFALGGLLCEILTGGPPNRRTTNPGSPAPAGGDDLEGARARVLDSESHPDLVALALDCLAPEIEARPQNAGVVSNRLKAHRASLDLRAREAELSATTARAVARSERRSRRRIASLSLLAIVAVLAATGAWVAFRLQDERRLTDSRERVRGHQDRALHLASAADWESAVIEADRARRLAQTEGLERSAVDHATDLVARLEREHEEAMAAAEFLVREQNVAEQLERLRVRRFQVATRQQVEEEYFGAFQSLQPDGSATLAELLPRSGDPQKLVDGVLDWAILRRYGFDNSRPEWWLRLMQSWQSLETDRRKIEIVDALLGGRLDLVLEGVGADLSAWEPPFLANVIVALVALGEESRVLTFTSRAAQAHPRSYAMRFGHGLFLTLADPPHWDEALVEFTAADALLDDRGLSAHNMGVAFTKLGRNSEAVRAFRRATQGHAGRLTSWRSLASSLIELGQLDEAELAIAKVGVLTQDADCAPYDDLLGAIHYHRGRFLESIAAFDRCLAASPDTPSALYLRGSAHLRLGNSTAAMADLQRLREIQPRHWRGLYRLGTRLYLLERYDEAVEVFEEALAVNPGASAILINLGQSLVQLGRPEEALGYLLMGQKKGAPRGTPIASFIAACRAAIDQ